MLKVTLTTNLKTWLEENSGLSANEASDDEYREAALSALLSKTLSLETMGELTTDPDAAKANRFDEKLDQIIAGQKAETVPTKAAPAPVKIADSAPALPAEGKSIEAAVAASDAPSPGGVNVIEPHKQYDMTRKSIAAPDATPKHQPHPQAGSNLKQSLYLENEESEMEDSSQLDKAINGVWGKWLIRNMKMRDEDLPQWARMTDHDRDLMKYIAQHSKFNGIICGEEVNNKELTIRQQKALLDDGTSDGLEIAPIMFDADIIRTPTLTGEFFPRVKVINVSRGRRIEGAVFPRITGSSSGQGEGTNITLFNTASMITAFDTTIFVWDGAIEIGLDFLADSPVNVGAMIVEEYGKALMQWLDNQIINGDGTTEPEGVINDAGIGTASSANGAGGPHTVGDYEAMLLGIPKRFRQSGSNVAFFGSEVSYRRVKSIAVGTTDARRVMGMDHLDYQILEQPFGVEENVGNANVGCVVFSRYRMYRRAGLSIRTSSEGRTLMRTNFMMVTARARFGGQLEDGNAGILISDMQA